jgi:hypothetical protein
MSPSEFADQPEGVASRRVSCGTHTAVASTGTVGDAARVRYRSPRRGAHRLGPATDHLDADRHRTCRGPGARRPIPGGVRSSTRRRRSEASLVGRGRGRLRCLPELHRAGRLRPSRRFQGRPPKILRRRSARAVRAARATAPARSSPLRRAGDPRHQRLTFNSPASACGQTRTPRPTPRRSQAHCPWRGSGSAVTGRGRRTTVRVSRRLGTGSTGAAASHRRLSPRPQRSPGLSVVPRLP